MPSFPSVPAADVSALTTWLEAQLKSPVSLVFTDNRSSILSVKRQPAVGCHLRVHYLFYKAPEIVWRAVVAYARREAHGDGEDTSRQVLRAYIKQQEHLIRESTTRRAPQLRPHGYCFDLEQIYHDLNQTYFDNRVQASITWGRRPPKRPRTSIRFGSYDSSQSLIRIHHLLDQAFVPQYFVESVVFHEMLHQLIPRQRVNGRWSIHPPAFQQAEQHFPYYKQAQQWQRQHLMQLLRTQ